MAKVLVIAEAGVNHNGDPDLAHGLIEAAAAAKADAIKFQTFKAASVTAVGASKADYQKRTTEPNESQLAMLQHLELSAEVHRELAAHCRELGLEFFSTPFDLESLGLLVRLGVKRLKLSSGEITNAPLLLEAARSGLPLLLSTGMCNLGEVEEALGVLAFGLIDSGEQPPGLAAFREAYASPAGRRALAERVTLLHCTTEYPAPIAETNLRAMGTLFHAFGLPVGLSDHTEGLVAATVAVALGAVAVEKHFTLDQGLPGPDHAASLTPEGLAGLVLAVRQAEAALGDGIKVPTPSEQTNAPVVRRSLVAGRDLASSEVLTADNMAIKRPGTGISPMKYFEYLGRQVTRAYRTDELLEP
jgi:N-acetylneuraminate synthase